MTVLSLERYPVAVEAHSNFARLLSELVARMRAEPGALWADAGPADDVACLPGHRDEPTREDGRRQE